MHILLFKTCMFISLGMCMGTYKDFHIYTDNTLSPRVIFTKNTKYAFKNL